MVGLDKILGMVGIKFSSEQLAVIEEMATLLIQHQNEIIFLIEHIEEIVNASIILSKYAEGVKK